MADWASTKNIPAVLTGSGLAALLPLPKLRFALQWLVGIWLLSMLADVFWAAFSVNTSSSSLPLIMQNMQQVSGKVSQTQNTPPSVDLATMQAWHLFGKAAEVAVVETVQTPTDEASLLEAQETRLQLKLLGVMLSTAESSYAVIEHAGQADLYRVGQAIPGGQRVSLSRVLADRAIIDNRGNLESLMLYDDSKSTPVAQINKPVVQTSAAAKVVDQRNNAQVTQMANAYREQLMNNPMSLADVIRISVAKDNGGNVIGYSIRPGRDRKQFSDFGLQSGDIVTAVNGIALDDPAKAMELYGQLRTAKEASLDIKRGSENINVLVGFSAQ